MVLLLTETTTQMTTSNKPRRMAPPGCSIYGRTSNCSDQTPHQAAPVAGSAARGGRSAARGDRGSHRLAGALGAGCADRPAPAGPRDRARQARWRDPLRHHICGCKMTRLDKNLAALATMSPTQLREHWSEIGPDPVPRGTHTAAAPLARAAAAGEALRPAAAAGGARTRADYGIRWRRDP